jgi:hypothetical protein
MILLIEVFFSLYAGWHRGITEGDRKTKCREEGIEKKKETGEKGKTQSLQIQN